MKKFCTALFASFMLVAFSAPAWANGVSNTKKQCSTKKTEHHRRKHRKIDRHKQKVLMQFKVLKMAYKKSINDAQQMFLEYLGSSQACPDTDVAAIRAEYEQQIAQLNETIAAQEQQISGLNATVASQEQQIGGLNTTIATQEQQIGGLNATVAAQEQQIGGLNATVASLELQIGGLNATIASQEQQIGGLNTTIATQEQQINGLNTTIATQEQQISGLNTTIATQEQQINGLNTTITSQEQQLTELNATVDSQLQQLAELNSTVASQKQQLDTQAASHQQEMDDLTAAMNQQCDELRTTAYNNGMTAGMETCATTTEPAGDPQLSGSLSTGTYYPYALDVDNNGNTFIVEKNYRSVVGYDSTGSQIAAWTSNTLSMPVDLAMDSQGDVFILDQLATMPLQKYDPYGQPIPFLADPYAIFYPLGMVIDSQDNVYVTDMGGAYGGRILKFNSTGALVATFGEVSDINFYGDEYCDIAVDEANQSIYIVTHYNRMVGKFGMDGTYQGAWQGDLRNPNSIAIGAQGQIFVADTYNDEIDQYDADGTLTTTITSQQLYRPTRIVVDNTGKLHIAVESYQSVQVYQ